MKSCFKLIAMLLTLSLVLGTMYFSIVYAENLVVGEELIENGDFEELDANGIPTGSWQTQKDFDPEYAYITSGKDGNNTNMLKLEWEGDEVDRSYARYILDGAQAGVYELNADIVYTLESAGNGSITGLRVLIEYYRDGEVDTPEAYVGGTTLEMFTGQSNDRWVDVSGTFIAPTETKKIVIWFLMGSKGQMWIDNLSCKLSAGPEPYRMQTDQAIYYTDDKEGSAKVEINEFYKPGDEEYNISVDFSLEYEGEVLAEKKNVVPDPETGIAEYKFDPSIMENLLEKYLLKAVLKSADGKVIKEFSEDIILTERPKNMNSNGEVLVDGKPWHPVIGYCVNKNFAEAKAMGVNTIHDLNDWTMTIEEKLDGAYENGMKVIIHLTNLGPVNMGFSGQYENLEACKEWVERLKDHPALLGWDMRDEPIGTIARDSAELKQVCEYLLDGYIAIREIDPDHPVYLLDYHYPMYDYSQRYGDIFVTDVYLTGDTAGVTRGIQRAQKAVAGRKPIWQINTLYTASKSYGMPTIDDIRGNTYRTFAAGAQGLGYFTLINCDFSTPETKSFDLDVWECDVYDDLVKYAQEEQPELIDYYLNKKYQTFNKKDDGGVHSLYYESWIHGNDVWMAVHNRGNEEVNARIPLYSNNGLVKLNGATAQAIAGTEQNLDITGSFLEVAMPPQRVYLYKLTPKGNVDFSKVTVEVANPVIPGMEEPVEVIEGTFSDLSGYEWASQQINELFKMGILNQSTVYTYSPAVNVTRGDAAGFLVKTLGLTAEVKDNFADVSENTEYANEIGILKALGIVNGAGDGNFYPETPITRQELMKICARGMSLASKLPATADVSVLDRFYDKASIAAYAVEDVAKMVEAGIINGDDNGNVCPEDNTTRAEVAVIMHKILNAEVIETEVAKPEEVPEEILIEFEELNLSEEQVAARESAVKLTKALGLIDGEDAEAAFTRGQAAKLLANIALNGTETTPCDTVFADVSADNEYSGYIAAVEQQGLMNGYVDGKFRPDAPITYHQFVKVMVDLLGYKAPATLRGGYPNGYLMQAEYIDLLDGVLLSKDMHIRVSDAAMILKNALDIYIMEAYSYNSDGGIEYDVIDGETLLTYYLDIEKYEGKITGNKMQTIYAPRELESGEIAMDTLIFKTEKTGAEELLGYDSVLYVRKDDNAVIKSIIYAEPDKDVSAITVSAEELGVQDNKVYYTDENGNDRSLAIASDAIVLYNGKAQEVTWTLKDFAIDEGQFTFISDGKKYTTVIIEEVDTYEVDRVMPVNNKLVMTDGTEMVLDKNDSTKNISIVNTKGKSLDLDDIRVGNIVSICESKDKTRVKVLVSTDAISGKVTKINHDSVVINDESYKLAYCIQNDPDTYGEIKFGDAVEYRLDYWGKIAAVNSKALKKEYGILCGMGKEGVLDQNVRIKIFTTAGRMEIRNLFKNVNVNGTPKKAVDAYESPEFWENGAIKQQLVVYKLNPNGDIVALETAIDGRKLSDAERSEGFSMDASYDSSVDGTSGSDLDRWNRNNSLLGSTYVWDDSTTIFNIPDRIMDDKYYSVTQVRALSGSTGRLGSPIAYYDIDENYLVPVGVVTFPGGSLKADEPKYSAESGVVMGFGRAMNEEGEEQKSIDVLAMDSNGKLVEKTILIDEEKLILAGAKCLTTEFGATKEEELTNNSETMTVGNLNPGDYIQYEVGEKTGLVSSIRIWLRAKTPILNCEVSMDANPYYSGSDSNVSGYGQVARVLENGFVLKTQEYVSDMQNIWEGRTIKLNNRPIVVLEKDRNGEYTEWTSISIGEMEIDDKVYMLSRGNLAEGIVCVFR